MTNELTRSIVNMANQVVGVDLTAALEVVLYRLKDARRKYLNGKPKGCN